MAIDLTRTRLRNYDVTWSSYAFGAVDKVTPELKMMKAPIKVGSVGAAVLGDRVVGLDARVIVEAREIDLAFLRKMLPWYSSGAVTHKPSTINKDLYDYAALLTLHPQDVEGTDQDLSFPKAVPELTHMARDGVKDDVSIVTFTIYPDRSQLPTLVYGYVGAVPS